jgi:PAS domain S-box-containing protein
MAHINISKIPNILVINTNLDIQNFFSKLTIEKKWDLKIIDQEQSISDYVMTNQVNFIFVSEINLGIKSILSQLKKQLIQSNTCIILLKDINRKINITKYKDIITDFIDLPLDKSTVIFKIESFQKNLINCLDKINYEYQKSISTTLDIVLQQSDDAIFKIDFNRKIITWNNGAHQIFGYSKEEILGQSIDFLLSDEKNFLNNEIAFLEKNKKHTILGKTKTGQYIHAEIIFIPQIFEGHIKDELVLISDKTKFISQNDEIISYRKSFEKTFMICFMDKFGILKYINENFEKSTLFLFEEVVGKNATEFKICFKDIKQFKQINKQVKKAKTWSGEICCFNKNKEEFWSYFTIIPLLTSVGKPYQYVFIGMDISKLKSTEESIKNKTIVAKSLKLKDDFLANVSHEIRTPLNSILGFTDLLLETNISKQQYEYLDVIKKSSNILLMIINDILDLTKTEEGKIPLKFKPFNLTTTITEIVEFLNLQAKSKNIELNCNFYDLKNEQLIGDEERLQQILINLLKNSIKYTKIGFVKINIHQVAKTSNKAKFKFEVIDTGIGIEKQKLAYIFNAFTQSEEYLTREYDGIGIGLTIVEKFVKAFGGKIDVESQVNQGSKFSFCISLEINNKFESKKTDKIQSKIKVLLAEDNKNNQILATTRLRSWGFEVDVVNNGLEVLELYKKNDYDVILMDLQMPFMDGYTATMKIRNNFPLEKASIPIIALTADASNGNIEKSILLGVNDYVYKPFKANVLYNKINEVLDNKNNINKSRFSEVSYCKVDFSYIYKECLKNEEIIKLYIHSFIKEFEDFIEKCNFYSNVLDIHNIYLCSHKILPSIKSFGLTEIIEITQKIHDSSKKGEVQEYTQLVVKLANYYTHVKQQLNEKLIQIENKKS